MEPLRLKLHTLSKTDSADPAKVENFWRNILEGFISDSPFAEQRLKPLANTIQHAQQLGCLSVVVQSHVQDPDYTAEYHAYHGRTFSKVERFCTRLHCFSCEWKEDKDILEAIDEATNDAYLGFITLRPVKSSLVGATILRPPSTNSHFLLARDNFDVHLAGKTFSVDGTPFMQQDNAVGACAQASIWMALRTLRKREGLAAHDPAQITTSATRFLVEGRTLPNRDGLAISQMMEAVRSAGYSPTLLKFRNPSDRPQTKLLPLIRTSIYPYIESEIPVILAMYSVQLGGHAVVLIGHGWQLSSFCAPIVISSPSKTIYVRNTVDYIGPFYIHNDNSGPYLPIPDTESWNKYSLDKVCYAIPLLPADVYMTAEESEQTALRILNKFDETFLKDKTFVVRTYLQERWKFRECVTQSTMADTLKRYYRLKKIPRRVWITEINLLEKYDQAGSKQAKRIGEIVIDPTGDPLQGPFLSMHLPGILIDRNPDTDDIKIFPVKNDTPYQPLFRH